MGRSRPAVERAPAAAPATRGPRPRPTPYPRTAGGTRPVPQPPTDEPGASAQQVAEELAALGGAVPPPVVDVWALVRQAQDGDAEAFGRLYDHYVTMVHRYLLHRVGDRAQAEDFTSETFVRALRRIDSLSFQGRDVGAWLVTIARNIVRDHVKSSRFRLEVTTADMRDADRVTDGPEDAVVQALTAPEGKDYEYGLLAMLWLAMLHGTIGVRTIINDYAERDRTRFWLKMALYLATVIVLVVGTLVIFTFDPCADPNSTLEVCRPGGAGVTDR